MVAPTSSSAAANRGATLGPRRRDVRDIGARRGDDRALSSADAAVMNPTQGPAHGVRYPGYILALLTLVYVVGGIDKAVMTIVIEPIRAEFHLSDTQVGFVTSLSFAIAYAVSSVPLGVLADRMNRRYLIASCVGLWSLMTAASGMAQSSLQLVMMRVGVAASESGSPPAALSMIADLYPPERRASAVGVYHVALPLASLIALAGGGVIAERWGWRAALLSAGLAGLVVAVVFVLTVREPRRTTSSGTPERHSLHDALQAIRTRKALLYVIGGAALSAFASSGLHGWIAIYCVRAFGVSVSKVGLALGPVSFVASTIGALAGGLSADFLSRGSDHARARVLGMSCWIAVPLFIGVFLAPTFGTAILCAGAYMATTFALYGPLFALLQSLAPVTGRATTIAVVYLVLNVVGYGMGSQLVGVLSDLMPGDPDASSLRLALLAEAGVALAAGVLFFRAAARMDAAPDKRSTPS